ncbi:hypothetical protein [Achromobacter marplatensis]|uniref:hypothetical protein n=1 Tax=Achromobacter marplatensis TaxID=470868 RepID=UPI0039F6E8E3
MTLILLVLIALLAAASVAHRCLRRQPGDTGRSITRNVIAGALTYGLIGPAIGLLVVMGTMTLPVSLYSFDGLRAAYLFGAAPAVLCGVTAGALKPAQSAWSRLAWVGAAGTAYGFLFMLAVFGTARMAYVIDAFKAGALPSLAAAVVCTLLFYGVPGKPRATPSQQP